MDSKKGGTQMRQWPVVQFILNQLQVATEWEARLILENRLTGKPEKKQRLLDSLFDNGYVSEGFRSALSRALGSDPQALLNALAETRRTARRLEWETRFQSIGPHFYLETLKRPSPLFAAACLSHRKVIELPELSALADTPQKIEAALSWFADHRDYIPDCLPVFGDVDHLLLYISPDEAFRVELDGRLSGPIDITGHSAVTMSLC